MSLPTGTQLGPYRIVAPLGAGGMGEVYRAHDDRLGREVAVKVLPESTQTSPEALARFEREARAVAALSHPNILAIHDVGRADGRAYAVTELLEGETLRERLRRGALGTDEAFDLSRQILAGLAAAHAKGIVHRDVKPENLFITAEGPLKILDFGVARITGTAPVGEDEPTAEQFRTGTGVVLGTVAYMAPEQLRGKTVDQRADIFSFGCVLCEMLTGERPFAGETSMATAAKILNEEPSLERVPARLRPVVAQCLHKEPAKRFAAASEVKSALAAAWQRSSRGARAALAGGLALVLLAAAGAAVWKFAGGSRDAHVAPGSSPGIVAVAVLPFVNLGGDAADEYLSDGLTEELINVLGQVEGLRIPGRTSSFEFKGKRNSLPEVAAKLDVQHAIEGSVQRSGERIRIRVQLVTVPDGFQVWSQSYDEGLSDLLAVQNRIARAIVGNLRNRNGGGGSPVPAAKSVDPEAYRLYLRGRHFADRWTRENFEQALSSYRAAIERDPAYAPAYAGLAELYSIVDHRPALMDFDPDETYRLGIQFAEKALIVDPESSEAHSALGHIYVHTGQWAEAERHLAEAIRINPNSAGANLWYALLVQILGRSAEGKAQRLKAVQLDPLSIQVNTVVMAAAWRDGDFDQAIEFGRAAVTVAPEESEVWGSLAIALAFAGRFREADEAVSRAASSPRPSRMVDEQRARLLALEGRKREAQVLLEEIESDPERNPGPIALMRGWAATGDLERALPLLEQAVEKSPQYARVNIGLPPHPVYRELRNHPRYREALRKLGLPN